MSSKRGFKMKTPWYLAALLLWGNLVLGLAQPAWATEGSGTEGTVQGDRDTVALVGSSAESIIFTVGSLKAMVDGQPYTLDAAPYIKAKVNRVLVPIRLISAEMGIKVDWRGSSAQVFLRDTEKEIVLSIGSGEVLVNGERQTLDCPPEVVPPGRTFVPLRFVIDTLGARVDYEDSTGKITIAGLTREGKGNNQTQGVDLYQQALNLEKQKSFTQAANLYAQALPMLLEEKNTELAALCSEASQRLMIFQEVYPYTREEIQDQMREAYPQVTAEQTKSWIESKDLEHYFWDGEEHYFQDAVPNLMFRNLELMQANPIVDQRYYDLVQRINQSAGEEPASSEMPYQKPVTYRGTHTIFIPRDKLPEVGTYRIWLPVPIDNGANGPQTQVTIESVIPDKWVKQAPSVNQDIGLLYLEVPMEDLTEDLLIQVKFTFTHYEQRFSVDPENVGEYDEDSDLFQKYTRSYGNTEITPDIQKKAQEIAGDETNPYLAARKIYDYIVHNVDYSFMPHFVLCPRTSQTESDYVHKFRRGDCGAQSRYFAAMCRALGIPARSTGGWQLFNDDFRGHFWAEFYLPNYGWIPVDTSGAQLAFYPKNLTPEERQAFIDYYFANQDSMRCVVQKDTDEPLIPKAQGMVLLPMAIQVPTVGYSIPTGEIPDMVFLEHWTMECEKLNP
jgi:transglutaminase-like putative cysteine protease